MLCYLSLAVLIALIVFVVQQGSYSRRMARRGPRGAPRRGAGKRASMNAPAAKKAAAAESEAALTLARVISVENAAVIDEVRLSINKPTEYFSQFGTRYPNLSKPADVQPFFAALDALQARQLAGAIDHRAAAPELKAAVDALLRAKDIQGFNWAFLNAHLSSGAPMMLNAVRNKLAEMGWTFFHIKIAWDNLDFALVPADEFPHIAALKGTNFTIAETFAAPH